MQRGGAALTPAARAAALCVFSGLRPASVPHLPTPIVQNIFARTAVTPAEVLAWLQRRPVAGIHPPRRLRTRCQAIDVQLSELAASGGGGGSSSGSGGGQTVTTEPLDPLVR